MELTLKNLQDVMDIFNAANSVEGKIKEGFVDAFYSSYTNLESKTTHQNKSWISTWNNWTKLAVQLTFWLQTRTSKVLIKLFSSWYILSYHFSHSRKLWDKLEWLLVNKYFLMLLSENLLWFVLWFICSDSVRLTQPNGIWKLFNKCKLLNLLNQLVLLKWRN